MQLGLMHAQQAGLGFGTDNATVLDMRGRAAAHALAMHLCACGAHGRMGCDATTCSAGSLVSPTSPRTPALAHATRHNPRLRCVGTCTAPCRARLGSVPKMPQRHARGAGCTRHAARVACACLGSTQNTMRPRGCGALARHAPLVGLGRAKLDRRTMWLECVV